VADIFESEVAQKILKAIGGFLAFALAIGTVIKVTKFFGNVFLGSFKAIFDTIGKFVGALGSVQSFFVRLILGGMQFGGVIGTLLGTLGRVGLFLTGPWGIAIAAAVTALTWFFTQTEVGKKLFKGFLDFLGSIWTGITDGWNALVTGISSALSGFGKFFQDTWNGLVAFFKPMIDGFAIAFQTAWAVIKAIIDIIVAVFTIAFVGIGWVVQGVWNGIKANFEFMWNLLKPVVEGVQKFFEPIFKGIGDFIGTVWKGIQIGFQRFIDWIKPPLDALFGFFKTVFDNIKNFLKGVINTYIGFAEGFVNFFIRGLNFIIDRINTIKLAIPEIMRPLFGGKKEIGFNITRVAEVSLPRLAKGGVVYPSSGGSMVTVAEAGRPERIEPLNPNGLSDRDMAIINKLSGTSGPQIQVTVNPSAKMDERELAMQVSRQIAYEIRKGGY
jgi:phage-related protein